MLFAFQLLRKLLKELSKPFLEHATLLLVRAEVLQVIQDRKQLQTCKNFSGIDYFLLMSVKDCVDGKSQTLTYW